MSFSAVIFSMNLPLFPKFAFPTAELQGVESSCPLAVLSSATENLEVPNSALMLRTYDGGRASGREAGGGRTGEGASVIGPVILEIEVERGIMTGPLLSSGS